MRSKHSTTKKFISLPLKYMLNLKHYQKDDNRACTVSSNKQALYGGEQLVGELS